MVKECVVSPACSISTEFLAMKQAKLVTASSFIHQANLKKTGAVNQPRGPGAYKFTDKPTHTDLTDDIIDSDDGGFIL